MGNCQVVTAVFNIAHCIQRRPQFAVNWRIYIANRQRRHCIISKNHIAVIVTGARSARIFIGDKASKFTGRIGGIGRSLNILPGRLGKIAAQITAGATDFGDSSWGLSGNYCTQHHHAQALIGSICAAELGIINWRALSAAECAFTEKFTMICNRQKIQRTINFSAADGYALIIDWKDRN